MIFQVLLEKCVDPADPDQDPHDESISVMKFQHRID